jgi:hypothetical protein
VISSAIHGPLASWSTKPCNPPTARRHSLAVKGRRRGSAAAHRKLGHDALVDLQELVGLGPLQLEGLRARCAAAVPVKESGCC